MRGKERRTTVSCRATIPKYIVEKILSQGGTGSAHPYRWAQLKRVRKFAPRVRKPDEPDKSNGVENLNKNKVRAGLEVVANDTLSPPLGNNTNSENWFVLFLQSITSALSLN